MELAIAVRVRTETTLPVKWIAARLLLGSTKSARAMLRRPAAAPQALQQLTLCQ